MDDSVSSNCVTSTGKLDFRRDFVDNQCMVDAGSILIITAISIMTILITVIGFQIIVILKEIRLIVKRINAVSQSIENVGERLSGGASEIMGFVSGIKNVLTVVDTISDTQSKHGKR